MHGAKQELGCAAATSQIWKNPKLNPLNQYSIYHYKNKDVKVNNQSVCSLS